MTRSMSLVTGVPAPTAIRAAAIDASSSRSSTCTSRAPPIRVRRDLLDLQRQPWIAMPDDRPVAVSFVNQDHRVTVGRVAHDGVGRVDLRCRQRLADPPAVVIAAKGADVCRSQPERRARGERRRHLAPARDRVRRGAEASRSEPVRRQPVDQIHRVLADPDDVEARSSHRRRV